MSDQWRDETILADAHAQLNRDHPQLAEAMRVFNVANTAYEAAMSSTQIIPIICTDHSLLPK
jgi:hypothetical protein